MVHHKTDKSDSGGGDSLNDLMMEESFLSLYCDIQKRECFQEIKRSCPFETCQGSLERGKLQSGIRNAVLTRKFCHLNLRRNHSPRCLFFKWLPCQNRALPMAFLATEKDDCYCHFCQCLEAWNRFPFSEQVKTWHLIGSCDQKGHFFCCHIVLQATRFFKTEAPALLHNKKDTLRFFVKGQKKIRPCFSLMFLAIFTLPCRL